MSQATKRKHVQREVLQGNLKLPEKNQQIVRVLKSKGNNLHEVETPLSSTFLVSMPCKFRKNVWIKKGDYILVETIAEGGKVKAEMVQVITPAYKKFLKKENLWPNEFLEVEELHINNDCDGDLIRNCNYNNIIEENNCTEESD